MWGENTTISKGRIFRLYVEEHYPFGDFALIRVRGDMAEVGFVLASEDLTQWSQLRRETWEIATRFQEKIVKENLQDRAVATVGKDLDFFTVSIIVDLRDLKEEAIGELADQIMGILREYNPYRKEDKNYE